MPNDHIKSEISAYLSGGLPEARNRQIDAHVAGCEKCRQALGKARARLAHVKREALKKAAPDPLPNLFLARQGKETGMDRPASRAPAALVGLLVVVGAVYGLHRFFSSEAHPSEVSGAEHGMAPVAVSSSPVASSTSVVAAVSTAAEVPAPASSPLKTDPLDVKQEWRGADSGIKDSRLVVIRNGEAWAKLWAEMQQKDPLPPVRFGRRVVVCVFGGGRVAGAAIHLGKILEREEDVRIPYAISGAPVAVSTTSVRSPGAPSHPYLLSVIPRIDKRIRLTQNEENP
jgi:hypothetical protein